MLFTSSCEGSKFITLGRQSNLRRISTCRNSSSGSRTVSKARSGALRMQDRHVRAPGINQNTLCAQEIMLKIPRPSLRNFGIKSSLGNLLTSGTLDCRTQHWLSWRSANLKICWWRRRIICRTYTCRNAYLARWGRGSRKKAAFLTNWVPPWPLISNWSTKGSRFTTQCTSCRRNRNPPLTFKC
jgi:hypothetical protein